MLPRMIGSLRLRIWSDHQGMMALPTARPSQSNEVPKLAWPWSKPWKKTGSAGLLAAVSAMARKRPLAGPTAPPSCR